MTPEQVLEMPSVVIGTETSISELLLDRRERYGFSYYVVGRASMPALAPVVARLSGR